MIKKFLYFFNKHQKKYLLIFFILMVITTILEIAGLGLIYSIVGSLGDANTKSGLFTDKLSAFFELDKTEIFSSLLLIFIFFYLMKIVFLLFYNWFESSFLFSYKEDLSSKLFQKYLNQDFNFFYNRNSSEFIRNVITEVDRFVAYLISVLKLTLEIIILIGIFFFFLLISICISRL